MAAEVQHIEGKRNIAGQMEARTALTSGLALSGGGIRSAIFGLGVLQSLAHNKVLKNFDYLSTVSGGGYIGSALIWYLSKKGGNQNGEFGLEADNFPFGSDNPTDADPSAEEPCLKYLRQRGNYLTPGDGIGLLSGAAVVLRGIFVNVLVWLTLMTAVMAAFVLLPEWLRVDNVEGSTAAALLAWLWLVGLYAAMFFAAVGVLYWIAAIAADFSKSTRSEMVGLGRTEAGSISIYFIPILLGLTALLLAVGSVPKVLEAARGWIGHPAPPHAVFMGLKIVGVEFLLLFIVGSILYSLSTWLSSSHKWILLGFLVDESRRYRSRRQIERIFAFPLVVTVIFLVVGFFPELKVILGEKVAEAGGPGAFFVGTATSIWAHFKPGKNGDGNRLQLVAPFAAVLVIVGLLFTAYMIAFAVTQTWTFEWLSTGPREWLWIAAAIAVAVGWFVNINYLSLHRFYRDRLMEAFLPDLEFAKAHCGNDGHFASQPPAEAANRTAVQDLFCKGEFDGPFHIVNTNLVLIKSGNRKFDKRGGENFVITPLHAGSEATGWHSTGRLAGGGMTLATAMATSGAAADPHTGVGGVGLLRSWPVAFLLSFLNIRLGLWVRNLGGWNRLRKTPNQFMPGLRELLGLAYKPTSGFLHLSDGGHFENLAVYELIRREVDLIVVCDAGADPKFDFKDLQNLVRRVEADFDAKIRFIDKRPIKDVIPSAKLGFPKEVEFAKRGHAVAAVKYRSGRIGTLIYLKTTMIDGLGLKTLGYKGSNPLFPDQTTADQFFDAEQFEAYRELGWCLGNAMYGDLSVLQEGGEQLPGLARLIGQAPKAAPAD